MSAEKYNIKVDDLGFNSKSSTILHIDLNSCFATIEQQANPLLRGKPVAVAAYTTDYGCIIAPSVEAKKAGIRVGMRVKDGKFILPKLTILPPDPPKYRDVHLKLRSLLSSYTPDVVPKSIDEFVLNLDCLPLKVRPLKVAKEIKVRIKKEIGEWLTVSVGLAPNRYLAKLAAGLNKPDGLDEINKDNFLRVYFGLGLTDLPYIKLKNAARLNSMGIYSLRQFYEAPLWKLKGAFASIAAYYWFLRLRGWEIDDVEFGRHSYGNSYALPIVASSLEDLSPILSKLVEKMSRRLRKAGFMARGVQIAVSYRNGGFWHKGISFPQDLFLPKDIYKKALGILAQSPYKTPVRDLAVSCFKLRKRNYLQLSLLDDVIKGVSLVEAIDQINERFGEYLITPARLLLANKDAVPDRIAFGGVKELEEFTLG